MPADVNISDIAVLAGVSVSTVSRVLNHHPDVSNKTRTKVLRVIEEQSYIPNNSARSLKRESLKAVGVLVKGFTNPFFTNMLTVIQTELEDNDYMVLLHPVDPGQNEIDAAISLVKEKKPQGLIFLGGNFQQQREKMSMLDIPYVMATSTLHKGADRNFFSSVTVDDFMEAYRTTERIVRAGHEKIAAIGYMEDDKSISRLRVRGFLQALQENHVDTDLDSIAYSGAYSMSAGYEAAVKLLRSRSFTCLFCISDVLALGAMRAIHDAGYRIPEEVSVVGFDGIESGRYAIPSLATVKQPDIEMAHKSTQILLGCMRKKAPHEHLVFEAAFVQGESFCARDGNIIL